MSRITRLKFYRNGVDEKKPADIAFSFTRVDANKIAMWPEEQKKEAAIFIKDCKARFNVFTDLILKILGGESLENAYASVATGDQSSNEDCSIKSVQTEDEKKEK